MLLEWNGPGLFPRIYVGQVCLDVWDRIWEYTARNLTYEEDILNGMLGIFKSFELMRAPVRHHFGVPLVLAIRWRRYLRETIKLYSTILEQFVHGLCWKLCRPSERRANLERFPSWSWIGWLGRVSPGLRNSAIRDTFKIKIAIEMMDGTSIPVEKFFSLLYNKVPSSALSSYLQIEAETIELSIQYLISEFEVLRHRPGWWAKIVLTQGHVLYAELNRTLQIKDSGDLAKRLSEREWRGIILGEKREVYSSGYSTCHSLFFLIVDDAIPITERIGCIDLEEGVEWVSDSLYNSYDPDSKMWMDGFPNGKLRRVGYWRLKEKDVQIPTKRRSFRLR
jgi:hypothetical protein